MSLRRRLLIALVAVAAVLVGTGVVLSRIVESVLLDRVDRQLVDVASRPIFHDEPEGGGGGAGGGGGGGGDRGHGPRPLAEGDQTYSEYFLAVGSRDSSSFTPLSSAFRDEGVPPPSLDHADVVAHLTDRGQKPKPFTVQASKGSGTWRLVAVEDPRQGLTVVGSSLAEVNDTVAHIRIVQILGTVAVLGALGLVSWWMLRLGVHPLEDMAQTADAIASGDLSHRVEHPSERTEVGRLGVALNSMLERIEEAFGALEASEERVRRFAADASHELRTPLTSIQGYAELWRAGGLREDAELADAMRRIEQEAHRMGSLVEDLLLLARLDQRRPLERAPVRLDEIAADAVQDARAVEPGRPIEVSTTPVSVDGDELRLRQVVANLLANARMHTPAGTPVRVTVEADADAGVVRLVVTDAGPGMTPEVAANVFERFYRADPSRGRTTGSTGLGLSIVAAIAEAHDGRATVSSEPGAGSRFVVELAATSQPAHRDPDGPSLILS